MSKCARQLKRKCKHRGCFEPADCKHGFCAGHCTTRHAKGNYPGGRATPKNSKPHLGVELEVEFRNAQAEMRGLAIRQGYCDGSLGMYSAEFKMLAETTRIANHMAELVVGLWSRGAIV